MGRFDRNSRGGFNRGRDNFRGRDRGFNDRGRKEMFDVTCSKCGKEAQVPFKPTGSKPVLCSECFDKQGGRSSNGSGSSEDMKQINAKLDKIIAILQDLELDVSDDEFEDSDSEEEN